jgi:hypothetical protein
VSAKTRGGLERGHVIASRLKGCVTWQARISSDRGRLEVVGIVPASTAPTVIEPLTEPELLELLGESTELHDESGHSAHRGHTGPTSKSAFRWRPTGCLSHTAGAPDRSGFLEGQ